MYLTLGQAAKEAKKSKATISKYIKNGKLSVINKTDDGFQIDPAELFRVFPQDKQQTEQNEQSQTHINSHKNSVLEKEIEVLRETIEELKLDKEDYKTRLDNAERRIAKLTDTISQQTLLLTDMREKSQIKPVERNKKFLGIFPYKKKWIALTVL